MALAAPPNNRARGHTVALAAPKTTGHAAPAPHLKDSRDCTNMYRVHATPAWEGEGLGSVLKAGTWQLRAEA